MKKIYLLKILVCLLFLCLLFIDCNRGNQNNDTTGRQSGRNNVGVFTLTAIPMNFEGKFVSLEDGDKNLIGVERINSITIHPDFKGFSSFNLTLPKISNGEVNIPLWNINENNSRYSGNHSFDKIRIGIYEESLHTSQKHGELIDFLIFSNVTFVNGTATRNWTDNEY